MYTFCLNYKSGKYKIYTRFLTNNYRPNNSVLKMISETNLIHPLTNCHYTVSDPGYIYIFIIKKTKINRVCVFFCEINF